MTRRRRASLHLARSFVRVLPLDLTPAQYTGSLLPVTCPRLFLDGQNQLFDLLPLLLGTQVLKTGQRREGYLVTCCEITRREFVARQECLVFRRSVIPDSEKTLALGQCLCAVDSRPILRPHNEAHRSAMSNLAVIMGRAAAHSNKLVTWDETMASNFQWCPNVDAMNHDASIRLRRRNYA